MSSIFKILKNYTFDENVLTFLSNFDKGQFGIFSFDKCILSHGDQSVNLSGISSNNTFDENSKYFLEFYNFIKNFLEKEIIIKNIENIEWKKQKKENKEKLINFYILKCKNIYNLSFAEQTKLENFLNINIKLNYITSNDIIIKNDEIESITNILFDEKKRLWTCNYQFNDIVIDDKDQNNDEISHIYLKIDKYLEKKVSVLK